ncbi:hypothetical protein CBS101457_002792 [Exobasidium rhododendri]|nr:hypothetical protein CBS101457_002792 [Exobasidium rhododendri]
MRIAIFGASRGVGLEVLLRLLNESDPDLEVHVLVRNKRSFQGVLEAHSLDSDKVRQVRIFVGDALQADAVTKFIVDVASAGPIDYVISSLGALPVYSVWKPLTIRMPEGMERVCSESMSNILESLEAVAAQQPDKKAPRLIVVSSNGMGKSSHDALPMVLRHFYSRILDTPHADKRLMEELLHKRYNIPSVDFNRKKGERPKKLTVFDSSKLFIIRPSLFTDGQAKGTVRTSEDVLRSAWMITRKDTAAYIVGNCMSIGDKTIEKRDKFASIEWKNGLVVSN